MGIKVTKLHEIQGTSRCTVKNGKCSHLCFNRPTDYVCRCPIDYELAKDKLTCLHPEAFLLFSKHDNIGRISINYSEDNHIDFIPFKDKKDPQYLDVDIADRRIYIADKKYRSISRAFLNGSEVQKIIETGLIQPDGIAVDYLAHNIYFTDSENRRIEVARLDGRSRRILIWKGIEEPRSLILEPRKGYMYWSEWPSDSIRRAAMDGSDLISIISNANHAVGLTIDADTRKLYWAQDSQPRIEMSDFDGKKRQTLITADVEMPFAPHSLTVFHDFIYWSDWNTGTVEKAHKITGQNRSLIHSNLEYVTSVIAFHSSRQTGSNQCRTNNGGCSHLCLAMPYRKMTCACPTHYQLAADERSCLAPKHFLIFSQKNSFGRLLPNSSEDSPDCALPVFGKNIRSVEYDPVMQYIYWVSIFASLPLQIIIKYF
jgi:low density lipoprotein receptor-related protein 5/6